MVERFQILSMDGGGVKGLFSAAVLAKLEEDLGIRLADHFDLIAGTSTGGIIALGLGAGLSPAEIVDFYVKEGPKIFAQHPASWLQHLVFRKFGSAELEAALKRCFGEKRLGDSTKRLVIPSYNLDTEQVYVCKTPHHERLRRDYKAYMWQVAMATAAAPTYLPGFNGLDGARLIDGGVWANNPSIVAITEACSMLGVPLSSIRMLSLGTTYDVTNHPFYLDWGGQLLWARSAAGIIMRAQSEGANGQAQHLIGTDCFVRVNPVVPKGLFALDRLNLDKLMGWAADVSRKSAPAVHRLIEGHDAPEFVAQRKLEEVRQ
ncbi:MAG: patatin-like phospholipase family protein [Candidatus Obscuribacterales bacterium]|nr:patatin-like phospholipase family protein [Candidatus Obscuribacterales bacterium]